MKHLAVDADEVTAPACNEYHSRQVGIDQAQ